MSETPKPFKDEFLKPLADGSREGLSAAMKAAIVNCTLAVKAAREGDGSARVILEGDGQQSVDGVSTTSDSDGVALVELGKGLGGAIKSVTEGETGLLTDAGLQGGSEAPEVRLTESVKPVQGEQVIEVRHPAQ